MQKLFGGILIAGVSGLCLLLISRTFLINFGGDGGLSELISMLPMPLIYATIPIAIGVGLFLLVRHLIHQADADTQSPQNQFDTFQ
jgi:ABC-type Fe3+ transport system permease subunit